MNLDLLTIFAGIPKCTPGQLTEKRVISSLLLILVVAYVFYLYRFAAKRNSGIKKIAKEKRLPKRLILSLKIVIFIIAGYIALTVISLLVLPLCTGF